MIEGVRCVIGPETFFCASISTDGSVGPRSAGLACGAVDSGGACFSCATGVTTRGRTALLLSCAFISTAAKRTATTNRATRVRVFICLSQEELQDLSRRVEGRQRGVRFAHATLSC